jgi:hypothetical protein
VHLIRRITNPFPSVQNSFVSAPLSTYHQISCIRFAVHLSLLTPSILCDSADPRCCGIDHSPQPEKA